MKHHGIPPRFTATGMRINDIFIEPASSLPSDRWIQKLITILFSLVPLVECYTMTWRWIGSFTSLLNIFCRWLPTNATRHKYMILFHCYCSLECSQTLWIPALTPTYSINNCICFPRLVFDGGTHRLKRPILIYYVWSQALTFWSKRRTRTSGWWSITTVRPPRHPLSNVPNSVSYMRRQQIFVNTQYIFVPWAWNAS